MTELSIPEAAHQLGMSEHSVRRRLANGELIGRQMASPGGFRWIVELEPQDTPDTPQNGATGQLIATLRGQVEAQAKELTELREDRRREVSELHVLLQTAQTALTAPKENSKHGWQFWRK